jgi:catechol 2,3-dioxygenase-like lactoylglutathione lyase family enzyme
MRMLEVHLECGDLAASVAFYTALIPQVRLIWDGPGDAQAFLVLEDGSALGLWQKGTRGIHRGRAGAHVHWALEIAPAEYEAYRARIAERGVEPLEHQWPDGAKSLYFFDPDGHQGEFMTKDWLRLPGDADP